MTGRLAGLFLLGVPMRRICNRCGSVRAIRDEGAMPRLNLDLRPMGPKELATSGRTIFGDQWVRPLARLLDCNPSLLRQCKKGERALAPQAAAKVRALAQLGSAGEIVRKVVGSTCKGSRPRSTHLAALVIMSELAKRGLLVSSLTASTRVEDKIDGPITQSALPHALIG
jgi:hypothetical protein